jgi:hypothetical protein
MSSMQRKESCASLPTKSSPSMDVRNWSNMALNHLVWLASIQSDDSVRRSTSQRTAPWAMSGPVVARMTAGLNTATADFNNDGTPDLIDVEYSGLADQINLIKDLRSPRWLTADSILLYAGNQPVFVIDAYTRRIFSRLGLKSENDTYDAWQTFFMKNLPSDVELFNEYHALLVGHGKATCRKQPICGNCCLRDICGARR